MFWFCFRLPGLSPHFSRCSNLYLLFSLNMVMWQPVELWQCSLLLLLIVCIFWYSTVLVADWYVLYWPLKLWTQFYFLQADLKTKLQYWQGVFVKHCGLMLMNHSRSLWLLLFFRHDTYIIMTLTVYLRNNSWKSYVYIVFIMGRPLCHEVLPRVLVRGKKLT